ncbi:MAG TPA: cytochrome P450, partial [Nocardioides sp.]
DEFRPEQNAEHNLVFGIGPHVCPGRALTLMELRVAVVELLAGTERLMPAPGEAPVRERPPVSGWAQVPVVLT